MSGICGWFGPSDGAPSALIGAMRDRLSWTGMRGECALSGQHFGLGAVGAPETIGAHETGALRIVVQGHPHWGNDSRQFMSPAEVCRRLADEYRQRGADALTMVGGDFALALIDLERGHALLAIDRMGVRNLVYRSANGVLVFAANLDSLAAHPSVSHRVDPQALYNYVYFHMVPGPGTIFEGTRRLLPGHCVVSRDATVTERPYWTMQFDEARDKREQAELKREFIGAVQDGVAAGAWQQHCGTFLSGGTDSSTVTGMLSATSSSPVRTYSIGFDAAGYDEMEYARIASRCFKTDHHEYYVTPADVVAALPIVASEYDQPFGNASAVPTYYCAQRARADGVERMLAGDGGDELFGGNARYARQYQLDLYGRLPPWLRTHVIEPALDTSLSRSVPLLRKGGSYVRQAQLPMPARYESYNLLERLGPENVFAADFLAGIARDQPLSLLSGVYHSTEAESLINRMATLDLKFTLADNDLPKVTRMCDRAGVDVAFPLLHDSVVAFSGGLAPGLKLRRTRLRYFFKEALRDFLPREIIAKQKHGFGLPAGPWLASYAPLRAASRDALANLGTRRIFKPQFLDSLVDTRLQEHPGYYGTMIWILMMLELWFQHHVDRH